MRIARTPSVIRREAVSRYLDVVVPVSGRSIADVAADIQGRLAGSSFPLEYHAEVVQESAADETGRGQVAATAVAVVIGLFLLMQAAFRSWRFAALGFLPLPLSLAGGLAAAALAGGEVTLGTLLGLLAVLVLTTRGVMLLIAAVLAPVEGTVLPTSFADRVRLAAAERMGPVLATSGVLVAIGLPFVVLGPIAGLEVVHPMAVALTGGLVTSAFATLLLLPAWCAHAGPGPAGPARRGADDELRIVDLIAAERGNGDRPAAREEGARQ